MGIKEEITKIAVEQGYEGAKPKSIAQAIDALTDTLAGEDVKSGRSVVDAIRKYAPYVGKGGGGAERVELFNETVTTVADGINWGSLAYTGDITDDPLVVVFDGTEYELPRSETEGLNGKIVTYGTPLTDDEPDFSTYPLAIKSGINGRWTIYTETAGTHIIAAYTEKSSGGGFEPKGMWEISVGSGVTVPTEMFYFAVDSRGPLQSMDNTSDYGNVYRATSSDTTGKTFGIVGGGLYVAVAVSVGSADNGKMVYVQYDSETMEGVTKFVNGTDVLLSFQVPESDLSDFGSISITMPKL